MVTGKYSCAFTAVHDDLAGAFGEGDTGDRCLAAAEADIGSILLDRVQVELAWLLCFVLVSTCHHVQVAEHATAQTVLGKHAANGDLHHGLWLAGHEVLGGSRV
jgi:hypothetical protein